MNDPKNIHNYSRFKQHHHQISKPFDYTSNNIFNPLFNTFQFVLMAPTSPAVKINEDSLTYLNQGQNYELKFCKIQPKRECFDPIIQNEFDPLKKPVVNKSNIMNHRFIYLSVIRLCFWERKLQEIEQHEIKEVFLNCECKSFILILKCLSGKKSIKILEWLKSRII